MRAEGERKLCSAAVAIGKRSDWLTGFGTFMLARVFRVKGSAVIRVKKEARSKSK